MTTITPAVLSANADFQGLLAAGLEILTFQTAVIKGMNEQQLHDYTQKVKQLRNDLKSRSTMEGHEIPQEFTEVSGLALVKLQEVFMQMRIHAMGLNEALPELQSLNHLTRLNCFFDAIRSDSNSMSAIAKVAADAAVGSAEIDKCESLCIAKYMVTIALAMSALIGDILACSAIIILVPVWLLCVALGYTLFFWALGQGQGAFDNCIANCQE